jgi:hypothetical protein
MKKPKTKKASVATLSAAVVKQLERLGARIDQRKKLPTNVDSSQGLRALARPVATLSYGLTWPKDATYCSRDDAYPKGVQFDTLPAADKGDYYSGVPVIQIAYDGTGFGYFVPVDGGRRAADPPVYRVDHAGPYELEDPTHSLSTFLRELDQEQKAPAKGGVRFADDRIAILVQKVLKLGSRPVTPRALQKLSELMFHLPENAAPADLAGLEQCTSLRTLNAPRARDLTPLAALSALRVLRLKAAPTDDLEPLGRLHALEELVVSAPNARQAEGVTKVDFIEHLSALKKLTIWGNVPSLEPLAGLAHLEELTLWNDVVSDIDALADLSALRELTLVTPALASVQALSRLTSLRELNVQSKVALGAGALLAPLINLERLVVRRSGITSLDFVKKMRQLDSLDLIGNAIADARPLLELKKLRSVDLSSNRIALDDPTLDKLRKRKVEVSVG